MCLENQFTQYDLKNIPLKYGFYCGQKHFSGIEKLYGHIMKTDKPYLIGRWMDEKDYRPKNRDNGEKIPDYNGSTYQKGWHIFCKPNIHPYVYSKSGREVLFKNILAVGYDNGILTVVAKYLFILPEDRDLNDEEIENLYFHLGSKNKFSLESTSSNVEEEFRKEIEIVEFAKSVMKKENIRFTTTDNFIVLEKPEYNKKANELLDYLADNLKNSARFVAFVDLIDRHQLEFQAVSLFHIYGFKTHKKYRAQYDSVVSKPQGETFRQFLEYQKDVMRFFR